MATLSLSPDVIQLSVTVSPTGAVASGFNLGLIVGTSAVIAGSANDRVRLYTTLADMVTDGFSTGSAEYKAAALYFSQAPQPAEVAVGRWNSASESALDAVIACRSANTDWYAVTVCGASNYDIANIAAWAETAQPAVAYFYTTADATDLNATAGTEQVETATVVAAGGVTLGGNATVTVTAAGMLNSPKAISVAVVLNDTASQVAAKMITALAADPDVSYMFTVGGIGANIVLTSRVPATNDATLNIAIANGTCTGLTAAPTSTDTTAGVSGSVGALLDGLSYAHTIGQYSTTTTDAVAAIMGYAMGANTGTAGTAYTLAYKPEVGVTVEALSETQLGVIKGENLNAYVSRGSVYNCFEQGVMASGMHFDTRIGLDQIANDIRIAVMNLLTGATKIPQTESGVAQLKNAIVGVLKKYGDPVNGGTGFTGPGTWTAAPILSLSVGDMLPLGNIVLTGAIRDQSQVDRAARKSPPIYVCLKLAGAIETVVIAVNVNL